MDVVVFILSLLLGFGMQESISLVNRKESSPAKSDVYTELYVISTRAIPEPRN